MATGPHISFSAEKLFEVAGFSVTNSIFTSIIVSVLIIAFAIVASSSLKNTDRPTGVQNFLEWIIESLYDLVLSITQSKTRTQEFFPLVASFFFFILLNNWVGVLPGVGTIRINEPTEKQSIVWSKLIPKTSQAKAAEETENTAAPEAAVLDSHDSAVVEATDDHGSEDSAMAGNDEHATDTAETGHAEEEGSHAALVPIFRPATADLNGTLALSLIAMFSVQFFGIRHLKLSYFKKFINFSSPIMFFVGILETVSELSKIISFAFRLFGNIFAGEVLLSVLTFIGGTFLFFIPMPFYGLEIFVGLIQALVFTMLSLVLINMATVSHEGDH